MAMTYEKLSENPLLTREDVVRALLDLCRPLRQYYSVDQSTLHVGSTAAHYGEKSARMEGWARVLWGLGPLFAGDNSTLPAKMQSEIEEWQELYRTGLVNGTDPQHPGYWGDIYDYDQKMVETAAIAVALALAPKVLWDPLEDTQKEKTAAWLGQINDHKIHPNNWRFFRILVNMTLKRLGYEANEECLKDDFGIVEHCYKGDGWYFDGNDGQLDYYIPFAMHFYSLIWSELIVKDCPGIASYCKTLQERSMQFSRDFVQWFSNDGTEVPFGRSLTYRFAHSAFFSALALADVEALPWGAVRHMVLQNLRHWFQLPIFDNSGILTIGYEYPNLIMSEKYNAPGSPYWSFKTFLILALPLEHPFWKAQEQEISAPGKSLQVPPRMLICREKEHITMYPAGQHCMEHGNSAAKYEKFVYSNRFGFSVSRGTTLEMGAFDNTLAVSPAGWEHYCIRYGIQECKLTPDYTYTAYEIFPGVLVKSWIVPCGNGWHVRIHRIRTEMDIDIAEGGFAVSVESPFAYPEGNVDSKKIPGAEVVQEDGVYAILPWGTAGIFSEGKRTAKMIRTAPNTNLMVPLAAVPTLTARLPIGEHLLIHSVFGDVGEDSGNHLKKRPVIVQESKQIRIGTFEGKKVIIGHME